MSQNVELIEFSYEGGTAKGNLIKPEGEAISYPALIIVHEWWGLNEHIRSIAERFAGEGYVVLAPDLFDGVVTKSVDEASQLMQALKPEHGLSILNGAVEFLKATEGVDANRIGVTGFCMGGTFALLLACKNLSIKASAPFYGDVPAEEVLKDLSAPVLFIGAENDNWITQEKIMRVSDALAKYEKLGEVKIYSGAGHAFFNDTRPEAYNAAAAEDAWKLVNDFLAGYLK
jgi:carboxymethylenebutenolidase